MTSGSTSRCCAACSSSPWAFSGEIDADGRTYVLDELPGVEEQDIVW
jgi:hypothetical protein